MALLTRAISITTKFNNKHLLRRELGDFVVQGSNNELFQQRVPFNMAWWKEKLVHLENFFDQYILPELAYPRLKFGLDRYDFKFNC